MCKSDFKWLNLSWFQFRLLLLPVCDHALLLMKAPRTQDVLELIAPHSFGGEDNSNAASTAAELALVSCSITCRVQKGDWLSVHSRCRARCPGCTKVNQSIVASELGPKRVCHIHQQCSSIKRQSGSQNSHFNLPIHSENTYQASTMGQHSPKCSGYSLFVESFL